MGVAAGLCAGDYFWHGSSRSLSRNHDLLLNSGSRQRLDVSSRKVEDPTSLMEAIASDE